MLIGRNRCHASEFERQKLRGSNVPLPRRPIAEDLRPAPPALNRNILLAIDRESHRRRSDSHTGVELPQRFAIRGAISGELAVGPALKYQIAGGGQRSTAFWIGQVNAPGLLLCDRVPGDE